MKIKILILLFLFTPSVIYAAALRIQERRDMRFATIAADPAGDVITLTPDDTISGVNASLFIGNSRPARFRVRGDRRAAFGISFSSGDTLTGPGAPMSLTNFTHNAGVTPTLNNGGNRRFDVGADLIINPIQLGGSYSGTYSVFVDYQ